jgi:hypothetical protein
VTSGKAMPADVYNAEARDPVWAPAMETSLGARFKSHLPDWLRELSLPDVECRTTSCRLVVTYPSSLLKTCSERAKAEGLPPTGTPMDWVMLESGPLARGNATLEVEKVNRPDGTSQERATWLLFFDPQEFEPAAYAKWVKDHRHETEQTKKIIADSWRQRQEAASAKQHRLP